MMEKLKACPHCGGKAVFEQFNNPKNWYVVRCTVCGCQTDGFRINHDDATDAQNKSANAAVWNRRAEPENKALTLEQLRQMDGKPIWIEDLLNPELSRWIVVDGVGKHELYAASGEIFSFDSHGETWFTYSREPEGSEKS